MEPPMWLPWRVEFGPQAKKGMGKIERPRGKKDISQPISPPRQEKNILIGAVSASKFDENRSVFQQSDYF